MKINVNTILFNAAGVGLVIFLGAYMINSAISTQKVPQCSTRYGKGQQFSLQDGDGGLLNQIQLQARLPNREWGLLHNARIVEDQGAALLQVALGHQTVEQQNQPVVEEDESEAPLRDGVGFVWQPQNLQSARAACLSYRVFLSKDFPFDQRGTLPGLYALKHANELDSSIIQSGFATRLGWGKGGAAGITLKTALAPPVWISARPAFWPVDRWVSIEQEVILNQPKQANGVVRLWIDGKLSIDAGGFNLSASEERSLSGVVSDVGYDGKTTASNGRITISPFVVHTQ